VVKYFEPAEAGDRGEIFERLNQYSEEPPSDGLPPAYAG
jgi:hypothetical protein